MRRQLFLSLTSILLALILATTACNVLMASKPMVVITSPPSGSTFREGDEVAVQSTATDSAGVVRVELVVDGTAVRADAVPAPQGQPSFTIVQAWKATRGTHTIMVRAYNKSGAVSDPAAISISVTTAIARSITPTPTTAPPRTTIPPTVAPPTAPLPVTCTDDSAYVSDVTIQDATVVAAGQAFSKTWRVRNTGTCTWGAGYQFVFVSGAAMTTSNAISVSSTAPGAAADLTVPMTAPTASGTHAGVWQLRNLSGVLFGQKVSVKIVVPGTPTSALAIQSFTADAQDIAGGNKRLTFTWQSTGATTARIVSGTRTRFFDTWQVPPSGTFTIDVSDDTNVPNPSMTLVVEDGKGNQTAKSVKVNWQCKYNYFFTPVPDRCPNPLVSTAAAEQAFQSGRMIWLEKPSANMGKYIIVLYNDGHYEGYNDDWTEGQPTSDPTIVAPAGLYQPIRGFGKVWRENVAVRQRLGWATAPEQGFNTTWQYGRAEGTAIPSYVRALDQRIIYLIGVGSSGNWRYWQ